ncbi:hypothetical protein [Nonomuraea rhizosphaerae]|uniref:hypothetical protein n=1 Tax=Nonomuraea rhizosphaerae TaxID=2665663 RepID=UPI001C5D70D0|nr:hypothetical protein [Nonomuraea rhizosphaerae]
MLDTETTHLDPALGSLWEIALICRDTDFPDGGDAEFWWQVKPDLTTADPASLQVGKYYERSLAAHMNVGFGVQLLCGTEDGDTPEGTVMHTMTAGEIALQLARHLDGATIIANNPRHDRDFLRAFMHANGQAFTASHRMEDIRALLTGYVYGRLAAHGGKVDKAFTGEAAEHVRDWLETSTDVLPWEIVGVTQTWATKHTALGDARCVRDVHDAITGSIKR